MEKIRRIRENLQELNLIKEELAKLQLSPEAKVYFEFEVSPLLRTFEVLSYSIFNLSGSAERLSNINLSKTSEIKDIIELVYDVTDSDEDVFEVLKCKIDVLIKISKSTCCKKID